MKSLHGMKKDDLAKVLGKQPIKRASGQFISTEAPGAAGALSHFRTGAKPHYRSDEEFRVKRGYALDVRLIDRCKAIAISKHKKLYEVMEEALTRYVAAEDLKPTR